METGLFINYSYQALFWMISLKSTAHCLLINQVCLSVRLQR